MYNRDIVAPPGSRIILESGGESCSADLYSPEGMELLASLWLKAGAEHRLMYEPVWMGVPIIQFAEDVLMMQELIWKLQPDVILECGVAHGGSIIFYSSLCHLMGKGRVIGVDVEVREHNRVAMEEHPMWEHVELIEGSSTDAAVVADVKSRIGADESVLVVLDSNHSRDHVLEELRLYHDLIAPGGYIVAMDGAQAHVWDIPRGKAEWRDDHPLVAIHVFLAENPEFEIDPHYTRMHVTSSPDGFLRRSGGERRG